MVTGYSTTHTKLVVRKKASQTINAPLKSILHKVLEFSILGISWKNNTKEYNDLMGPRETNHLYDSWTLLWNEETK